MQCVGHHEGPPAATQPVSDCAGCFTRVAQLATVVGCSMGASVIWSHLELFGDARISKAVFVDQVPLQVPSRAFPVKMRPWRRVEEISRAMARKEQAQPRMYRLETVSSSHSSGRRAAARRCVLHVRRAGARFRGCSTLDLYASVSCEYPAPAVLTLQNLAEDWSTGSRGCYDAESLARVQMQLRYDFPSVAAVGDFNVSAKLGVVV